MTSIHVVAGVLRDSSGCILLAQRPSGKHLAGLWEFPGGKRESGESRFAALVRELSEEIGVDVQAAQPLITVPHVYPDKRILLDVWEVERFSGEPYPREGQPLRWVANEELDGISMPAADRPVITALRLPSYYLITPEPKIDDAAGFLASLEQALEQGSRLIQLRVKQLLVRTELISLTIAARDLCHQYNAKLLLNGNVELAMELGFDGIHLPFSVAERFAARLLPTNCWLAVSCHNAQEMQHAVTMGADFLTLSPIGATASHPQGAPLGWSRFEELVAECPLPVYALGGLDEAHLKIAREAGAQGVAGIRAFWPGEK